MLLSTGKGEEALAVAQKILKIARIHHKFKIEFQSEMLLFTIQRYLGHIQNPLNALEKLEKSLSEKKEHLSPNVAQKLDIEFSLKKSDILQRHGHIEKALESSQHAYQLSEKLFDKKDLKMAQVHSRLGANYWAKSEYEKSIAHYIQARRIFQLWGDQTSQIDSMGDMGLVYWSAAKYKKAEEILEKSIRMAEEVNARQWQTIQTGDLGVVSLSRGKLSRATALIEQHLSLSILTNNHTETERANSNIANVQLFLGDFEEAYQRLKRSLRSVEGKRLEIAIGVVRAKVAWALEGLGFQEDAIKYAKSALTHANKINIPSLKILTLRAISETTDNTEDRIRYAEEALEMARKHSRPLNEAGALLTLAEAKQDDALREKAIDILENIGSEDWLKAPVVFRTLRLPLLL
ncbi:MAG: tetratricopeptide repeat protein [Anaerolineae bacterium]|nr:tetratricopeptide repeat protein [Anaerolineae bacterium]